MKKLLILLSLFFAFNSAANFDLSSINVNGFGSFAFARSTSDVEYFAREGRVKNKNDFTTGSKAGLIISKRVNNHWDFTFQFLATHENGFDMTSAVDIFQASWNATTNLSIRAGKLQMPLWLISEYYEVGALIPWINPPDEVYQSIPIGELYGASVNYRIIHDKFTTDLDLYGGTGGITTNGKALLKGELHNSLGSSVVINYDFLTFRASYLVGSFSADISTERLSDSSVPGTSIVNMTNTSLDFGSTTLYSFGFKSEFKNTLLITEFAGWKTSSNLLKENQAYYILGGYYFFDRKLLLNFTYSQITKVNANISIYGGRQKSKILGAAYQVNPYVVLKLQSKIISPDGITFFAVDPGSKDIHFYEASIDFVF